MTTIRRAGLLAGADKTVDYRGDVPEDEDDRKTAEITMSVG